MGLASSDSGLLVAVDGGNSKTDVAVVTEDARVLAVVRGPGASPHLLGTAGSLDRIEELIAEAMLIAGVASERPASTALYLAGVDFARERHEVESAVAERRWSPHITVDNDTLALLRTGTSGRGVAIVCGAGINCVAVDGMGGTLRFPSLGRISGDWGGGTHLATEIMAVAARDEDGRGRATTLTDAVRRHFGTATVLEAIERLHFGETPRSALHGLNPLLFAEAETGDPVARGLVEHLADEIAAFAIAATRRLRLPIAGTPIVFGGGVLAARHPRLSEGIEARINEVERGADFRYVRDRPILGAVLLGLEHLDRRVDAETLDVMRADLAAAEPSGRSI